MAAVLAEPLGNPTGSHPAAQRARRLLEEARDEVADFLGRPPGEIVFTSGGTESANLAVLGPVEAARRAGEESVVLSSAVEHPAVREACRAAAEARRATSANSRSTGPAYSTSTPWPAPSRRASCSSPSWRPTTRPAWSNPCARVADAVHQRSPRAVCLRRRRPGCALSGPRASSVPGWIWCRSSAHKVGGPVGMGALAVGPRVPLVARQHGGGQERERRSGTQDVVGAVGLAAALRLAAAERDTVRTRVAERRDRLAGGLLAALPEARRTVPAGVDVLPGHLHLCLAGRGARGAPRGPRRARVCASRAGSSCASGALEPSQVLAAMGVPADLAEGAIRFSLGAWTTDEDVDRALQSCRRRSPRCACGPDHGWHTGVVRVLVAMSGGVDSSVAAALLVERGHDVVGATLKLWGGAVRFGLLLRRRRGRCPAGGPAARHRTPRLQPDRGVRPGSGGALRGRARAWSHAQPVYRVQPDDEVRSAAAPAPSGSVSTCWPPGTTPG